MLRCDTCDVLVSNAYVATVHECGVEPDFPVLRQWFEFTDYTPPPRTE